MLRIVLATVRRKEMYPFVEALNSFGEVFLAQAASGAEALNMTRLDSPHLVIIDDDLPDIDSLDLARELLVVNAMVNSAICSDLSEEEFHQASEGLGVLSRLPLTPVGADAAPLLQKLKNIL